MLLILYLTKSSFNKFSYTRLLLRGFGYSKLQLSSFSNGYIKTMYDNWIADPSSVHPSWHSYFQCDFHEQCVGSRVYQQLNITNGTPEIQSIPALSSIDDHLNVAMIIKSYQKRGHLLADLDPLHIYRVPEERKIKENPVLRHVTLPPEAVYTLPDFTYIGGNSKELPLKEIIEKLEQIYCNKIGVEYTTNFSGKDFIKRYLEYPGEFPVLKKEEKIRLLEKIFHTYQLETFFGKKWPSEKRFGVDGSEVVIPAVSYLIDIASGLGSNSFVIGMAHRGRMNVLANVVEMNLPPIFSQFRALEPERDFVGDVKYHLGIRNTFKHPVSKKPVSVAVVSNASHLESSAAIVQGKTAGEQIFMEQNDKNKVWPILIHGDAAICGQGVVYETFHLSELHCYNTGGTIHFVVNNQIGFTTDPYLSRSTEYCTGIGKINESPVFHVNGNDVEAVMKVVKIAAEYRAKFQRDVIIDIIGYRRFGHSEADEPMFTQPLMYKKIKNLTPTHEIYAEQLVKEKVLTKEEIKKIESDYNNKLEKSYEETMKQTKLVTDVWIDSPWKGFFDAKKDSLAIPETGADLNVLLKIGDALSTPPANFNLHRALQRIFAQRKKNFQNDTVDWSCGESFAYASLMQEGIFVRLTGQDVERGTFSHRHHVLHDQVDANKRHNVISGIFPNQATYSLCNSSLSEFGVLSFEAGMSLTNPNALIMWEAQFGDFCNTAQIVIDQYLCSGEGKWLRQWGVVMLLPHGMEGQGPEHSSARLERFLQLSDDDDCEVNTNMAQQMKQANWFIVNPSTPANFFHVLRRQVKLNYRKPLIIFTPKFLLRYPGCVSSFSEFITGTKFKPYIPDPNVSASNDVTKLLLCSGKVYYELIEARGKRNLDNKIAIGRLEQISPVPYSDIMNDALNNYPQARVFWVQEEHKNQGAWTYISPRLNKVIGNEKGPINYIGRQVSSSSGAGYKSLHEKEKKEFFDVAMCI